jgi:UPF0176 protein
MEKRILLYYKYVPIQDPQAAVDVQKKLCKKLGLKGRILIGTQGINGTVDGTFEATQAYMDAMDQDELFSGMDFKQSIVDGAHDYFPKLAVRVREEVVTLGLDDPYVTPENSGVHLTPDQVHQLLEQRDEDVVVFDARNEVEWVVGAFEGAIKPEINNFRDLPTYIDQNLDQFKDKKVLMYCTGGVRCELATAYMKMKGVAKEVYQVEGGIHRYAEQYPDGFFRGKNYVFDGRVTVKVNDDILGSCHLCNESEDKYTNCINAQCNYHFITCDACLSAFNNTCSPECKKLVEEKAVIIRTKPQTLIQACRKSV